jgi:alpha-2-macroglobulin
MKLQGRSFSDLWKRFIQLLGAAWLFLGKIVKAIFGSVQWSRPKWIDLLQQKYQSRMGPKVNWLNEKAKAWCASHKKELKRTGLAVATLAILGVGGYLYWDSLPKPQQVQVTVHNISATRLEENAKPSNLVITFDHSAARLDEVGKTTTEAVKLKPDLEGTWTWNSDKRLVFVPANDWPVDQEIEISLPKKYYPEHLRLDKYTDTLHTPKFQIQGHSAEFYQHPENPKDKRVTATVRVTHPVDPESLKGKVTIELTGNLEVLGNIPKEYKAELNYDKFFGQIMVTSDVIPLPQKNTTAIIRIDNGWKSSRGGNKVEEKIQMDVEIPGLLTFFKVADAQFNFAENQQYELEQVIAVETTTEVLEKEFDKSFEMLLLPKDRAAEVAGGEPLKDYPWNSGEMTPEILAKAQKIEFKRVASERSQTKLHTFKIKVPENRSVYMKVKKGLKSYHEYILAEDFETVVRTRPFPAEIRILHEGSILSLSGDKKLSVLTRAIKSFKVDVGHVLPDQLNHLISQSSGDFGKPEFMNSYSFNWDNIAEMYTDIIDVAEAKTGKPEFAAIDAGKFLNKSTGVGRGLMFVRLQPYDREKKQARGRTDSRFLLVTDLGVIEKKMADNSHEIFVQSVSQGQPVAGATVEVIGKNGLVVTSAQTNEQGRAHLPDLKDFKAEKTPLAFVVRKGQDLSFLPMTRYDRKLQYSRFDIGGIHTGGDEDALQAYIFTDRGLYRPGETYHLSGIVRSLNWKTELEGVPLEWVVTDPKGQEYYKEKVSLAKDGFLELSNPTQETSFVGTYTGALWIIKDGHRNAMIGSTTFRVEEFVPDRLKISAGFGVPETAGWTSPKDLKAWVRVMNMFGFPAEDNQVQASFSMTPAYPNFPGYKDYHFYFSKTEKSYDEELNSEQTNDKGEVEYPIDLSKFDSGNYRVRFVAEAFEAEGGRSVVAQASIMVSPSPYFIGYKTESDLGYLKMNSAHQVDFVAIDPNLKKMGVDGLTLSIVEKQWVSVLTRQGNGTFKYESVQRDHEVKNEKFKITNQGTKLDLPTSAPGDFKLVLTNKEGQEVSHLEFSVIGQSNVLGKIERNAELQIKLSRNDYAPGDEVEMQIRAPYTGSGLITIERDKIYAVKWFKSTSSNSMQTIRVPAGLEGNAYINVTYLRDIGSKEIFTSPLSYGIVPFSVDLKRRQLQMDLKAAAEHRPGTPLKIEYNSNKPGRIIVFAVDEGILQVAKYQTPDPLKVFFQKRALEIETSQLLDLVLPEYKIVKELAASGGDGSGGALSRNLNPFRRKGKPPVAFWSGLIEVDGTKRSVTYNVPDYFNGTLRIMAVAVTQDSIGVLRTDTIVRGDFIITPTVPFVLTPGDEAIVGVSVFNNLKGSGPNAKVKVKIQPSEHIEVLEGGQVDLEIPETKETRTTLKVRAKNMLGVATLKFQAGIEGKQATLTEDISLRPATPYRTMVLGGSLTNTSEKLKIERSIYPEFAKRTVAVSYLPLTLAHGLTSYLTAFPYGCTEQLISKAYPTLVLGDKPDFNFSAEQRDKAYKAAIATLRQRQTSDGGFGLYSSYGGSSGFPSLYAAQYLADAKERGFVVPQDMQDRVKGYLHQFGNSTAQDIHTARQTAYSLYLLARHGQGVGNEINTLIKEIEASGFKKEWPGDIGALFMASAFKLMQQDNLAEKYRKSVDPKAEYFSYYSYYHDNYIHNSFLVYLTAKHFPEKVGSLSQKVVQSIIKMIQSAHYNTLNSAMAISALEALSKGGNDPIEVTTTVSELDEAGKATPLTLPKSMLPQVSFGLNAKAVEIKSTSPLPIYYQASESGFDKPETVKEIKQKIEIQREYRAVGGKSSVDSVKMGEELEVHLKIRSLDAGAVYQNIAIVDLIPSGFEVVLERSAHGARHDWKRFLQPLPPEKKESWAVWMPLFLPKAYAQEEEGDEHYEEAPPESDGEGEGGGEGDSAENGEYPHGGEAPTEESVEVPTLAMAGSTLTVEFEEPREDRVVLYATVRPDVGEYIYKIKATNQGTFKIPPAFAEDMYDRSVQALGPVSTIKVEKNQ